MSSSNGNLSDVQGVQIFLDRDSSHTQRGPRQKAIGGRYLRKRCRGDENIRNVGDLVDRRGRGRTATVATQVKARRGQAVGPWRVRSAGSHRWRCRICRAANASAIVVMSTSLFAAKLAAIASGSHFHAHPAPASPRSYISFKPDRSATHRSPQTPTHRPGTKPTAKHHAHRGRVRFSHLLTRRKFVADSPQVPASVHVSGTPENRM